ncbi:hypothetical protein [Streptomyces sp. NPDC093589]|uniref:hypothetical protein n=1 Tax=Streptomyces sp. NPDC093589 TaxID=3366043 RepID=UPI003819E72A
MHDPHHTHDLETFAAALADELPGQWRATYHRHAERSDQFSRSEDVWDLNLVSAAIAEYELGHDALLTHSDGARLYVIGHPRQGEEYLVAAMAPHHFAADAFRGVQEPNGITVPDDPFRAADDITVDLLPRYDKALAQVQHNADALAQSARPATAPERVVMNWADEGHLVARPDSAQAAAVLSANGFVHDAQQQAYALPSDDTAVQARTVQAAGAQLSAHGIGVVLPHPPSKPALDTRSPAAPVPTKPTSRAR